MESIMEEKPLTKQDWPDIITYFTLLKNKEDINHKDLVEYFHFKYIDLLEINRWTRPDYIKGTSAAKKLLKLYDSKFSIELIDLLFKNYSKYLTDGIKSIQFHGLGLLSSDRNGWLVEKLLLDHKKEISINKKDIIKKLLEKPRESWTQEERDTFRKILTEDHNG